MRKAALYEAVSMIQLSAMPPVQFRKLHSEAKVTDDDLATLKNYLAPWKGLPSQSKMTPIQADNGAPRTQPAAEFNGLALDPNYRNWKTLSFTDRGDNNTLRFILGNDVAIRASRSGELSPWPNGSKIAKIAWQKRSGKDGLIYPGHFLQVELMEKNAQLYRSTDGWRWGRWRGSALQPYGKNSGFVEECTGCHLPVRGDDAVYTLPITSASVRGREVVNNRAVLSAHLPYQPLDWLPLTMYVDPAHQTMATLFGNDSAQSGSTGTVFALVTWSQREDPHWFGARIPYQPSSIEFVNAGKADQPDGYSRYAGPDFSLAKLEKSAMRERVRFILSLPKATLP